MSNEYLASAAPHNPIHTHLASNMKMTEPHKSLYLSAAEYVSPPVCRRVAVNRASSQPQGFAASWSTDVQEVPRSMPTARRGVFRAPDGRRSVQQHGDTSGRQMAAAADG
eukprot:353620-Chlamydomonas_euryale.AAC.1